MSGLASPTVSQSGGAQGRTGLAGWLPVNPGQVCTDAENAVEDQKRLVGFQRSLAYIFNVGKRRRNLSQCSRGDGDGVDGPDGKQRDGGEREDQTEGGGPGRSNQTSDQAERRPVHH